MIVQGVAGLAVYLNGFRIVGEKPWGGGRNLAEWNLSDEDLAAATARAAMVNEPEAKTARPTSPIARGLVRRHERAATAKAKR